MNRTNKILSVVLVILTILVASLGGLYLFNRNIDNKVADSKKELENLPSRVVPPKTEPIDSDSNSAETENPSSGFENIDDDPSRDSRSQVPNQATAEASEILLESTWNGVKNYKVSGGVNVSQAGDGALLNFESDFSFSGSPDSVVYICKEQKPSSVDNDCLILGPLQSNKGAQSWSITPFEFETYSYPVLWCRAFDVLMGNI